MHMHSIYVHMLVVALAAQNPNLSADLQSLCALRWISMQKSNNK